MKKDNPLVSICSITYNHAPYIRQCLESMLMQRTNFDFEIIINDDCSTDGTTEIIQEYVKNYPDIVHPIFHEENLYGKGQRGFFLKFVFPKAQGKYIALCEGDDYWTDPYKLQKQVNFLEKHPDYVMCSHRFSKYWQESDVWEEDADKDFKGADYDLQNLIGGKWLTQTLTVMFRRSVLDLHQYERYGMSIDMILFYELLKQGKGYCFPEVMGVYRYHNGGVWSEVSQNRRQLIEFKTRLAIYNVERSDAAAKFILYQFAKAMSRVWMLKQWRMMIKVIQILKQHYGLSFIIRLIFKKFILGKNIEWTKIDDLTIISESMSVKKY